jgi:hypothetical protein
MGLVSFAGRRVGFWVVARGISAADEVSGAARVTHVGEPSEDRRALVVAAADEQGGVAWAVVVHADGAAVLLEWRETLVAALGERVVRIDAEGSVVASVCLPSAVASASTAPGGLFVVGSREAWLLDDALAPAWRAGLAGDTFHVVSIDNEVVRLAAMDAVDWQEIALDARTGRPSQAQVPD